VARDHTVGASNSGRSSACVPAFDGAQCLHQRDTRNEARVTVPAVSPYADTVGYSRAVRDGRHIFVSGTAPVGIESADPYEQAKRCLEIIVDALRELGAGPEHVVRTRVYIVDPADWEAIGRAHGEVFGAVRPASAMLVITGTLDPAWKVEIEADALLPE
jgi:enamine deaminase RidA (YjgF/YER057c/UK114 family)